MECKTILRGKPRAGGYTLVEFTIAMALSVVVIMALGSLALQTSMRFASAALSTEMSYSSRNAIDTMTAELRRMTVVTNFTSNSFTVSDLSGQTVSYAYSPTKGTLTRTADGVSKVLLDDCKTLSFAMFKASPIDGVVDVEPTTNSVECKALKVAWTCGNSTFNGSVRSEVKVAETIVLRLQGL